MKKIGLFVKIICVLLIVSTCFIACDNQPLEAETEALSETKYQEQSEEATSEQPQSVEVGTTINAMSFNLFGAANKNTTANDSSKSFRTDVTVRGPKLNALLNGEKIDVAGFQEVNKSNWAGFLKNGLDEKYSYIEAHTTDIQSGVYIIYLTERLELCDSGVFWLATGAPDRPAKFSESEFQRICNWAIFKIKETGEYFIFMDTHLDTQAEGRIKQVDVLVSQIPELIKKANSKFGVSDCPVIFVGDLNSKPNSAEYEKVSAKLSDSFAITKGQKYNSALSTYTGFWYCQSTSDYRKEGFRIDYVWVSKNNLSVLDYNMIHTSTNLCPYGEYISDHNAIIAKIEFVK